MASFTLKQSEELLKVINSLKSQKLNDKQITKLFYMALNNKIPSSRSTQRKHRSSAYDCAITMDPTDYFYDGIYIR